MLALSANGFSLSGGIIGSLSVSAELSTITVEPALVIVVNVVLSEDWKENAGTVVAGGHDIGAFAVTNEGTSDALKEAVVVISLTVSATNWVVISGAVALRWARLHGQGDLVVAEEHAVALVGGATHGANGIKFKGAVAYRGSWDWLAWDGDVWVNPCSG